MFHFKISSLLPLKLFSNSGKMMFKLLLIWGLVFQLTFGGSLSYLYANDENNVPSEKILGETYKEAPWPLSILADELPATAQTPQVQAELKRLEVGLKAIEEGRTSDLPRESRDVFHLAGQRFEILKNGQVIRTFDLGQLNIELPYIAYDSLRVVIQGEDLVIEAVSAGDVVARHVIPNMHAMATALDRELLYISDREGCIHATDMAFNRTQALFRAPIPFFKNLWKPLKPLNLDGEVKLTFLTRGLKPFDEMDPSHPAHHEVVLPRERVEGRDELIYSAGDLVVYKEDASGRHLLGVFSRAVTHSQIARAKIVLGWLGIIANPSEISQSTLQELIKLIEAEEAEGDLTTVQDAMTPVARRALSAFSGEAIQAFLDRAKKNSALEGRVVDQMTLESWAKSFETLRERAVEIIGIENGPEKEAQRLKAELEAQDLGGSWQELSNPAVVAEKMKAAQGGFFHHLARFMPKPKTLKILGGIAAGSAAVAGGYAAEVAPIVDTLNYVWANWVPSVLHDAEYRWPLALSVISLLSFIPLCNFVGIASVPVMDHLSKLIGKLPGQRARKISLWLEERANTWRPMTTWQRNVSIGMRFYGRLILPAFHWIGNTICRQPNFLAALRAKMNPLSLGASGGAIGINSPLASRQTLHEKRQVLSDLAFHHNRANTMARNLALLVVSEKTNVDPATILAVLSGDIAPEDIETILKDSKKQREWDLVTEALSHSLESLTAKEAQALLEQADPEVLAETYEEGQRIAEKVRSRGHVTQALMQLKKRFFDISKRALSRLANFGVEDYELLTRGHAAPAIANQVRMEFMSDHMVVVGYPSGWGPRADLSDPKNLAADRNGSIWNLWTNPGHLYDLVMNTYAHFFASGSRQMVVYFKKPEVVETRYEPEAKSSLKIAERTEGVALAAGQWLKGLFDFRKSDLGGIFQKSFLRQITMFQAGLIMMFITRILIAEQNPEEALRGWWLSFTGSTLYIGWAWYVLQAGNYTDVPRVENKVEELKDHLASIRKGSELSDPNLVAQGRQAILDFYKEAKAPPEKMAQLEGLDPEALVEHAITDPPFATKQNGAIQWAATWWTVFITTYLGVVLTVNSLDNDHLSNANLLKWTGYWIGFSQGMWFLTSKKTWNFLHAKFDQAKAFLSAKISGCERLLDKP